VVKPDEDGAYVYQHLNLPSFREGPRKKGQDFKPDPGNPAVRHYRGATGNVSHGGHENPSCNRKSRNGNPPPKAGRARALSQHPQSPLRWTCKSVRNLAAELQTQGHQVSHMLVAELLHQQKYSLQANRKTKEGSSHPDRNAQFEHINARATAFLNSGQPAISVDAKKKEQIGEYKNGGREWHPKGQPETVKVHDFEKQKDTGAADKAANLER
jgi:hypothetical protein